ncbi:hypothetical protein BT69DRAFT_1326290 [Atractiella rhizophila]|nr:hypothetical protein BT69DRAFT_1326290 [Atractiella rhizophila]
MFINLMTMTWSEEQKKELKEQLKESLEQVLVERYGTDSPFELDFVAVISTPLEQMSKSAKKILIALSPVLELKNEVFEAIREGYAQDKQLYALYTALKDGMHACKAALLSTLSPTGRRDAEDGRFFLMDNLRYRRDGLDSILVIGDKPAILKRTDFWWGCSD